MLLAWVTVLAVAAAAGWWARLLAAVEEAVWALVPEHLRRTE
jgi:hypothetical protein